MIARNKRESILVAAFCGLCVATVGLIPSAVSAELIAASDDRMITEDDLLGLSPSMLRIARNEIFARHGYAFNSDNLRAHFAQYSWYHPLTKNVSLSPVEQANVAFIKGYEQSTALQARLRIAPKSAQQKTTLTQQTTLVLDANSEKMAEAQEAIDNLSAQIATLEALLEQQRDRSQEVSGASIHDLAEEELQKLLNDLSASMNKKEEEAANKYQTPIKPRIDHSATSPRELARYFPKIPWYDPQYADQMGEFWLESRVTDDGALIYDLKFLEPEHRAQNVASEFSLLPEDAEIVLSGLSQTYTWSETAKKNNVRDLYRKTAGCTPTVECQEKVAGNTSTQVDFLVFEQGATGARLIRNKGAYKEEYAMSIESAALLASYFEYVLEIGKSNFEAGSRTTEDLDSLFD